MHDLLNSLRCICAQTRLIVLDGLRRHALIGLLLFALAGTTSGLLFFDFIPRDIGRATNDFLFSVSWLTGFIFLLFHAVHVMAWDNERGTQHTFLARPISRIEYALALYFGLALLLLALNIFLGGMRWEVLKLVRSSINASAYFKRLSFPSFLLATAGLYWIQITILSIILLFSSAVRGSIPVLLLTLCYYFICSGLPVVRESYKHQILHGSEYHSIGILLKGLTAVFPDLAMLDFKTLAISDDTAPIISQLVLPFAVSTLYIVIALWLASVIYERRDLK